jgi:hypothetical protein
VAAWAEKVQDGFSPETRVSCAAVPSGSSASLEVPGPDVLSGTDILRFTIVAGNGTPVLGDGNCQQRYLPIYSDLYDQGGNVTWNDTTCPGVVADPHLGPLASNGGPTETVLLGSGSAARRVRSAAAEMPQGLQEEGRQGQADVREGQEEDAQAPSPPALRHCGFGCRGRPGSRGS